MSTARRVRRSMVAAATAAVAVLTLTSCGPSITDLVERSTASSVEDMQDDLWEYRDDIVADPETTVVALGRFIDFRQGVPPGYTRGGTLLLDVSDASDGPALTLLTSGGASTGGGWTYDQQTAAVCFTLTFPTTRDRIVTTPAMCPDLPQLENFDRIYSLEELDVRREVTIADYPAPICQCHSGSECDCPGG
ncbi:hypothetical protein [uncultured Microbacterium sp.]|uniref:hypothetical protein n=1 Tax=uncultured Microbacterium sp. TaxID=191216 RepID=UPI0028DB57F3|nr:hypothetical protein [uncultured Microbacterium sp.]